MRLFSTKTITMGSVFTVLFMAGTAAVPFFIPQASALILAITGSTKLHPSVFSTLAGLVIASLTFIAILIVSILRMKPSPINQEEHKNRLTKLLELDNPDGDNALSPEMQFALNAAFEKLKVSRESLEQQIVERTQELRDSLETASDIVETIPSALLTFQHNQSGKYKLITANPGATQALGRDISELTGKSLLNIFPENEYRGIRSYLDMVIESGDVLEKEFLRFNDRGLEQSVRIIVFNMPNKRLGVMFKDITIPTIAEREVLQERDRAQLYFDLAGSVLLVLDLHGNISMINKTGCKVIGYSEEDIVGHNWFELSGVPKARNQRYESFKDIVDGIVEPEGKFEYDIVTREGERRLIYWSYTCLTDALGNITGLLCSGEDVTASRGAELTLEQSEQRLRAILDSIQTGILIVNPETGLIVDANPVAVEMIGQSKDEIMGRAYSDIISAADDSQRDSGGVQKLLTLASGKKVPILNTSSLVELTNCEYHLESFIDITDRVAAEKALKQSEEESRQLLENANEGIFIAQDGVIPFCNPKLSEITGYDTEEMGKMNFSELLHPDDREFVMNNHRRRLQGEDISTVYAFRIITKVQETRWIEIRAVVIDWHGKPATLNFITDITDRKEAEEKLRESEAKYRLLTENLKDVVLKVSLSGVLEYVSPAIKEFGGYIPEEEISNHISKYFVNRIELTKTIRLLREVIVNKTSASFEFLFKPKVGKPFYIEVSSKPVFVGDKTTSILCVLRDINSRKKAEDDLKLNLAAMEASSDGMALLNEKGEFTYVNEAHAKVYGFDSPVELIGKSWKILYGSEELERFNNDIMPILGKNGFWQGEAVGTRKDGEEYPQEISLTSIDEDTLICVVRDITERKKAEEALLESEMRFRSVVENVPNIAVQGYNTKHEVIFWNEASELLYGYSREEALGKKHSDLLRPDLSPIDCCEPRTSLAPGEIGVYHKDGSIIPVYSSHMTLKNIQSEEEMYCFDIDLTALKMAQEQQSILQDKLERAERMESLGILAGGVAHDLNNMLGPMVGYSDLLLAKMGPESPYRKQIQRIGKSAQDAADVIQDLLTLARRGRYEIIPTDLNVVIRDYLDSPSFQQLSENRKDIQLNLELEENPPIIMGSSPHLAKIIMNLVVNSYDAMGDGGTLLIKTEIRRLDSLLSGYDKIESGEYIIFRVVDTGSGISEDDMGKIFEPYYSKKKMGTSGSGLGLAVVYGIVKDHNGYYDVFSTPGQGTEFLFYLPATDRNTGGIEESSSDYRGSESVLIIDDNEEQRQISHDLLQSLGYDVNVSVNGTEGVEYISENEVDIILIDMIMEKDYDGLDAYRDILKLHPGQKAIIISGFSATDRVNEMQGLGAGEYVRKPFTLESIGQAVRNELERSPQTALID
ncbi:MAG: PAS domain S-box protein [candidate division Zixibacteria bacterium]|nr:PAS domain S-box protein [candidate division Zixibacteria bacterium]